VRLICRWLKPTAIDKNHKLFKIKALSHFKLMAGKKVLHAGDANDLKERH
jgi:hypothetical protein